MAKIHAPGTFPATITQHGVQANERTGNMAVIVQYETAEGTIRGYFYLTDKAAPHTMKKLAAMGYNSDSLSDLANGQVMVGNRCIIEVQHEVGQDGQQRDRVAFVHPEGWTGNEIKSNKIAAANIKRFDALWKKERGAVAAATPVEEEPFN